MGFAKAEPFVFAVFTAKNGFCKFVVFRMFV